MEDEVDDDADDDAGDGVGDDAGDGADDDVGDVGYWNHLVVEEHLCRIGRNSHSNDAVDVEV